MTRDQICRAIGYVRVSTLEQAGSGAGLEAQKAAIRIEAERHGWELVHIYEDRAASAGTMRNRPALARALEALRIKSADALVVAKLDRLSRSTVDFGQILETAKRQNWAMVALDFNLDTSTSAGELVANVMISVAQWERRRIGERTREGLAVKRAQGVQLGRPREVTPDTERRIVQLRRAGRSLEDIARQLTEDGIPTSQGGAAWSWSTVRRITQRHGVQPRQRKKPAS